MLINEFALTNKLRQLKCHQQGCKVFMSVCFYCCSAADSEFTFYQTDNKLNNGIVIRRQSWEHNISLIFTSHKGEGKSKKFSFYRIFDKLESLTFMLGGTINRNEIRGAFHSELREIKQTLAFVLSCEGKFSPQRKYITEASWIFHFPGTRNSISKRRKKSEKVCFCEGGRGTTKGPRRPED